MEHHVFPSLFVGQLRPVRVGVDLVASVRRTGRLGRPSKFTGSTRRNIVAAVSNGVPIDIACRCAGIDDSTYRRWLAKGRSQRRGEFRDFVNAVEEAEANDEQ